ncbi:MAG: putative glycoside hydrolase [Oscillospiraceae bacterium]|nr:putative glycoside hydrolase [Oscillospiraceae bacterium]
MAIQPRDIYHGRRRRRGLIIIILTVITAPVVTGVILFYSLQKYIVYDKDGLFLQLPLLASREEITGGAGDDDRREGDAGPGFFAEIVTVIPSFDDVATDAGVGLKTVKGLFVPAGDITPDKLANYAAELEHAGVDSLALEMKPPGGRLAWASEVPLALSYGTSSAEDLSEEIVSLKDKGIYLIAFVSCFADELMATRNSHISLKTAGAGAYADSDGKYWLDPYNRAVRNYIIDLTEELSAMGFDEIVLTDFRHPENIENMIYSLEMTVVPDVVFCISNNAVKIAEAFSGGSVRVSVLFESPVLRGLYENSGQDADLFFRVFDRVYCRPEQEGFTNVSSSLRAKMKTGNFAARFVPITPSDPGTESFVAEKGFG